MTAERRVILIVTADEDFAQTLEKYLNEYNHPTMVARNAVSALDFVSRFSPILVLVDRSSQEVLVQLTRDPALRMVVVVSVQPPNTEWTEDEFLKDFEIGADASLCPKGYRELIARVRAIVRREQLRSARRSRYVVGKLSLDEDRHEVRMGRQLVELTSKEFQILHYFMENPSKAVSRDELVSHVWGPDSHLDFHTLDVHVHSLRRKIELDPAYPRLITTVRGVGYKLKSQS